MKLIEIECCYYCPFKEYSTNKEAWVCVKTGRAVDISPVYGIAPECPLPDAPSEDPRDQKG